MLWRDVRSANISATVEYKTYWSSWFALYQNHEIPAWFKSCFTSLWKEVPMLPWKRVINGRFHQPE